MSENAPTSGGPPADDPEPTRAEESADDGTPAAEEKLSSTTDGGSDPTTVAIACQGGGSHTAFTGGVLAGLLGEWEDHEYDLVGISGTSGGAFNALAAWYGLVTADADRSVELLEAIWDDLVADDVFDRVVNDGVVAWSRLESVGLGIPRVSPYLNPGSRIGQERIVDTLERHIDFDAIPDLCGYDTPELVVGTVDVQEGEFETFVNEEVTPRAVLASAAVPTLFEGVEVHGTLHWDGIFSQNPPVKDLLHLPPDRKPEELWVIQINPQRREGVPRSLDDIVDRRNELAGNLSLNQELRFVEYVNHWLDRGYLPEDRFERIDVHRLQLPDRHHASTKLDRSPEFLEGLWERGETRAAAFLNGR
ncbi:patatin-like phospholipase family protein [Natrarchaeobius oligotrophus]|uniref:Patatin-like phospholipase family protein n=1 Tax=Natrarchaeobius chitinivorans TaxID=1679083 RepID=A0A3N6MLN0_NATCH|nr:patatin-like phospholipase family protein [Natrarchaeobius chitinivorans]RQG96931.1 patatin-like phospholipase family protein [Natrarchaeobius chitinivorans]